MSTSRDLTSIRLQGAFAIRPTRPEIFMRTAELMSTRSTCLRGHVGCVIVRDGRIVSCGYNGSPPGQPHCEEVGCDELTVKPIVDDDSDEYIELGCQRAVHAEANALAWAARAGVSTERATMYCTHAPCGTCARLLVSAGVRTLFYRTPYRADDLKLLKDMGVWVVKL